MSLQLINITRERMEDLHDLLTEAYYRIYEPAFPDEDERESLEKMKAVLSGAYPGLNIAINILGNDLCDPDKRIVKGIGIAYYYRDQNVGLLAYNAIDPQHRERGLGKILVQSRIESLKNLAAAQGKKLGGAFIECNDPALVSPEDDSMDPALRLSIFKNWGAREVPIKYIQPPLEAGQDYCRNLLLLNYPVDGEYASKMAVRDFLNGIYKECTGNPPQQDPEYRKMRFELLRHRPNPAARHNESAGYLSGAPDFVYI